MDEGNVVLVMLRQPNLHDPKEMRTDPLWEFGSFGCTRCHRKNLMNPNKLDELNGLHLAFAQNGFRGVKLVHVTNPVLMVDHGAFAEARWEPCDMPLKYIHAPTLVNNQGHSDVPAIFEIIRNTRRNTPIAQFSSKFRSRRSPLPPRVSKLIVDVYTRFRSNTSCISDSYVDALPYPPPKIDPHRSATYIKLLTKAW